MKTLALVVLLVGALGCGGSSGVCGPTTCSGCCQANTCVALTNERACGRNGGTCSTCFSGDVCQAGVCMSSGFNGSGGGMSGTGGGTSAGGLAGGGSTCTPTTCVAQAKNCGTIPDGCGGMLQCGNCEVAGESCGGAGMANVCGLGSCTPTTCAAQQKNCGQIPDGCSSLLTCGTCSGSDTCGGGGMPNVCGRGCMPTTCAAQGKNCGQISDGCGRMLNCGTCMGSQTCGGAGTANVCAAACASGCPNGFSCDAMGACSGGSLTNLILDVPVPPQHAIAGRITRNGVNPTVTSCSAGYSRASIQFTHVSDARFNTSTNVPYCTATGDPFDFSVNLYPGTYKVTVSKPTTRTESNLPSWSTEVSTSFTVTSPQTNVVFDVPVPPQHLIAGRVTRNGVNPTVTSCSAGYSRATIQFVHASDPRFNTSTNVPYCTATSDPFDFSVNLYPGTYTVTVSKPTTRTESNLPSWSTEVTRSFTVSAPQTNVVFDVPVPPQHAITGRVTRNGSLPIVTSCSAGYSRATIAFTHASDSRFNTSTNVPYCTTTSDPFDFSVNLYPGTYKVTVSKPTTRTESNLPSWSTEVSTNFLVNGAQANVIFDVPVPPQHTITGRVTRNGVLPTVTSCSAGYSRATIDFFHSTDARFNTTTRVSYCTATSDPFDFSVALYPGTYTVTISKPTTRTESNLPNWVTEVSNSFTVNGPQSNVVFDVPVPPQHAITGRITRNGVNPTVTSCSAGYSRATVQFRHVSDSRFTTSTNVPYCTATSDPFEFNVSLYPGTYRVTISKPTTRTESNLPSWSTELTATFTVSAPQTNVVFDVPVPPQTLVTGRVTRNMMNPTVTSCSAGYSRATVQFAHLTDSRFSTSTNVPYCTATTDPFDFSVNLYPGVYKVTVSKPTTRTESNLPSWSTDVVQALRVP